VRFPKIPEPNGTFEYLCFHSYFPAPHNMCATSTCSDKKTPPSSQRLHIDLSQQIWTAKPESYWDPLIEFLLDDVVRRYLQPSVALKHLNPSQTW
jgi:hypothetical protein